MECPHCHSQIGAHSKNCKRCGGAIPSGQHLLDECGLTDPVPNPASSTAASAAPSHPTRSYRFARLGDRFLAFTLDVAVLFGLFALVDAWVFMRFGRFEAPELQLTTAALVLALTLNSTILFLYGCLFEAACGATLGKVLVGIRVVRTAQRGALAACAVRNLLRIIDGLLFYLVGTAVAACSDARQRLGDLCARTAVIEQPFGIGARIGAIALWIAILAGSTWFVPRICSASDPAPPRYLNHVIVRIGRTDNSAYFRIGNFSFDFHS